MVQVLISDGSWFSVACVRCVLPVPVFPCMWMFLLLFLPSRFLSAVFVFFRSMNFEGMCSGCNGSVFDIILDFITSL